MSALIFVIFQKFIFEKPVRKHTKRIRGYGEERQFFLKFFDKKSFAIMQFMICGGIALRKSGRVSEHFIAVFYTGLGSALLLTGLLFAQHYIQDVAIAYKRNEA